MDQISQSKVRQKGEIYVDTLPDLVSKVEDHLRESIKLRVKVTNHLYWKRNTLINYGK